MTRKNKAIRKRKPFQRRGAFFVYILECSDGSFYTGYTSDLEKRVALHNKGAGSKYVKTRLPAELVYKKKYQFYKFAVREERRIKSLSRSQKKQLLDISVESIRKVKRSTGQKGKRSKLGRT